MRYVIIILLLTISAYSQSRFELKCDSTLLVTSYEILLKQIGLKEKTGKNDGSHIKAYLLSVGIEKPAPYCMAGQYWCFYEASKIVHKSIPLVKNGVAISSYNHAKQHGTKTKFLPQKHDLLVWKSRSSWSGHVERVIRIIRSGIVETVGFNTSNGKSGSQREGNGVYKRTRSVFNNIGNMKVFGLVGFKP